MQTSLLVCKDCPYHRTTEMGVDQYRSECCLLPIKSERFSKDNQCVVISLANAANAAIAQITPAINTVIKAFQKLSVALDLYIEEKARDKRPLFGVDRRIKDFKFRLDVAPGFGKGLMPDNPSFAEKTEQILFDNWFAEIEDSKERGLAAPTDWYIIAKHDCPDGPLEMVEGTTLHHLKETALSEYASLPEEIRKSSVVFYLKNAYIKGIKRESEVEQNVVMAFTERKDTDPWAAFADTAVREDTAKGVLKLRRIEGKDKDHQKFSLEIPGFTTEKKKDD